jgi:hypothetical protein
MLTRVGCLKHVEVYQPEADLARYLAKYVACPPIAVRRIVSYDGQRVKCWYKDHKEKSKKCEEVDVFTFIGRMVQHIMPNWFQRVRYFGLEATKTFEKWAGAVREGGQDPMIFRYCGCEMEPWKVWHPKYGLIYDEYASIKDGRYEEASEPKRGSRCSVRPSTRRIQLSLSTMPA